MLIKLLNYYLIIKECLKSFVVNVCPKKFSVFEQISLSRQTVTKRIEDIADNIESTLKSRIEKCEVFSLALDGSTDIKDTNQMAVMIRGVTDEFDIVEELLDIYSMKGRTTGKNVHDAVMCILYKFNLQLTKLCGLTTDGAPSMIGKNTGLTTMLKKTLAHEIIASHCILHQEQKYLSDLNIKFTNSMNKLRSSSKSFNHLKSTLVLKI